MSETQPPNGGSSGGSGPKASPEPPLSRFRVIRELMATLPPQFQRPAQMYLRWQYSLAAARVLRLAVSAGVFGYVIGVPAFKAWRSQREFLTIPSEAVLTWSARRLHIAEAPPEAALADYLSANGSLPSHITLLDAVRVFRWATDDDRIKGLVADFSHGGLAPRDRLGFAQAQELRDAIEAFRNAKREKFGDAFKMIAYTDTFDNQLNYYLASAFDQVKMEPLGSIPLTGLYSVVTFYKNLLEKIGVQVQAEAREEYKSIVSTFTENSWPEKQRENLSMLLHDVNGMLKHGIATGRSTVFSKLGFADPATKVQEIMDLGSITSLEALSHGLIDSISHKIETASQFSSHSQPALLPFATQSSLETPHAKPHHEDKSVSLLRYKAAREHEKQRQPVPPSKLTVGIVYLCGQIMQGDAKFGSNAIAKALIEAGKDKDVSSIILRIDSGGGDAIASETIHSAVMHVRELYNKPIVASFGNVSASGGYYAAVACDKIIASPGTITGSIGVAALRPHVTPELMDKLGVGVDEIYTAEGGKGSNFFRKLDGNFMDRFKSSIDMTYDIFLKRVADGRNMTVDQVRQVAGGRVWTGKRAFENGLIDELGGFDKSIESAANLAIEQQKQNLPLETRNVIEKMEAKHHIEEPKPHIQLKIFPYRRTFWERIRNPEVDDLERDVEVGIGGWAKGIVGELWNGVAKEGARALVGAVGLQNVKAIIKDAVVEEIKSQEGLKMELPDLCVA